MPVVRVTAPSVEPLDLAEVKLQRRVSGTDDDVELSRLISGARQYAENYTGRSFITQTWDLFLDKFESKIEIPMPRLQSVTTVKYTDTDGNQQTLSSSLYTVNTNAEPGYIIPAYNESWPDIRDVPDAVEIRYIAGYGDASTDVPEDLRHALLLMIGEWNENTEDTQPFSMNRISFHARTILDQNRLFRA